MWERASRVYGLWKLQGDSTGVPGIKDIKDLAWDGS